MRNNSLVSTSKDTGTSFITRTVYINTLSPCGVAVNLFTWNGFLLSRFSVLIQRITAQNQLIGRDMYMYVQAKRSFNAQGYKFVRYFNNMHSLPGQRFLSDTFPQC